MPLIPGHLYSCDYPSLSCTFYGLYEYSKAIHHQFTYLFCVGFGTWDRFNFTCDSLSDITHIGHPSDFPEFLI